MWRLWNKLFGWDYIHFAVPFDVGIRRVYIYNNQPCYWYYSQKVVIIRNPSDVIWLTCPASKYFSRISANRKQKRR